jgi:hypothetical protein
MDLRRPVATRVSGAYCSAVAKSLDKFFCLAPGAAYSATVGYHLHANTQANLKVIRLL